MCRTCGTCSPAGAGAGTSASGQHDQQGSGARCWASHATPRPLAHMATWPWPHLPRTGCALHRPLDPRHAASCTSPTKQPAHAARHTGLGLASRALHCSKRGAPPFIAPRTSRSMSCSASHQRRYISVLISRQSVSDCGEAHASGARGASRRPQQPARARTRSCQAVRRARGQYGCSTNGGWRLAPPAARSCTAARGCASAARPRARPAARHNASHTRPRLAPHSPAAREGVLTRAGLSAARGMGYGV
jgi:hypothetical protein